MSLETSARLLSGHSILITGGARRLGYHMALTAAQAGADLILHHAHSPDDAAQVQAQIRAIGVRCEVICADLNDPAQAQNLFSLARQFSPVTDLINNAAIFKPLTWKDTSLMEWQEHLNINLTAPFLISQAFASALPQGTTGRIVNILDWRADRPGADHFPYTISKSALAAMTRSLAISLAPQILVNGLALGAILPPSDGAFSNNLLKNVPAGRWADLDELSQALLFLLTSPGYITGEIIHLDGGRHLV